jgi:hypothetical protein
VNYNRFFYKNNELLAIDTISQPEENMRWGLTYLCPLCGEVWGRVVVEAQHRFRPLERYCVKHEPEILQPTPGCLFDLHYLSKVPHIVLLNDFLDLSKDYTPCQKSFSFMDSDAPLPASH